MFTNFDLNNVSKEDAVSMEAVALLNKIDAAKTTEEQNAARLAARAYIGKNIKVLDRNVKDAANFIGLFGGGSVANLKGTERAVNFLSSSAGRAFMIADRNTKFRTDTFN